MNPRRVAFEVLRQVSSSGSYANLALNQRLRTAGLGTQDAAFVTELVFGTCRLQGTYDKIIEAASGRRLKDFQPAVVDLLRMLAHQGLSMSVPARAAVAATVELARETVGQRVTGLVNAVGRKITAMTLPEWTQQLARGADELGRLAVLHHHPRWIVDSYRDVLPPNELAEALQHNNQAPKPTLVVRPGLAEVAELAPATPTRYSPFGAVLDGVPGEVPAVRQGRAGVQDEGSQLVALALARAAAPAGPWLDLCAGPGGKAALLAGLARQQGSTLVANEVSQHRAQLVSQALGCYPDGVKVLCGDGRDRTTLGQHGPYARIMVDAPCSGLGALRRRPEARWRKQPALIPELVALQRELLTSAARLALPGAIIAYVTCSPHREETVGVVDQVLLDQPNLEVLPGEQVLPEVPRAACGDYIQLWPHRHDTDAMFLALLRCR